MGDAVRQCKAGWTAQSRCRLQLPGKDAAGGSAACCKTWWGVRAGAGQETGQKQTPDKRFIHEAEIKGVKKNGEIFLEYTLKISFSVLFVANHILKNRSEYN